MFADVCTRRILQAATCATLQRNYDRMCDIIPPPWSTIDCMRMPGSNIGEDLRTSQGQGQDVEKLQIKI